jgi:hypothetical protein
LPLLRIQWVSIEVWDRVGDVHNLTCGCAQGALGAHRHKTRGEGGSRRAFCALTGEAFRNGRQWHALGKQSTKPLTSTCQTHSMCPRPSV